MLKLRTILNFYAVKSFKYLKPNYKSIVYSSLPDIPTKKESIAEHIFSYCDKYSNKIAFIDDSRKINYSYYDVKQIVKKLSSALLKTGLQQGTIVAIIAQNSPEYLMLVYAISGIGCSVTMYNPYSTSNELKYYLNHSKPSVIFTDNTCVETVSQVASGQIIKDIYLIGERKPGYLAVDDLMNDSGNMNPIGQIKLDLENHIAFLPYSSGTTGLPKLVMLTHSNIVSSWQQLKISHKINNKIMLIVLPLYHIYGFNVIPSMMISSGSSLIFQTKFDPLSFLNAIEKYKVSVLHLVPPQILFFLNNPNVSKFNLSSVEKAFSGGASLNNQVECLIKEKFQKYYKDFEIYQGYGLTETSSITLMTPENKQFQGLKHATVGKLVSNMQCKVVDTLSGEELPANTDGELLIRGPNIMKGYLGNDKNTKESFENEWFKTGDIGRYDDDQYFYITGRIKELIKVKGLQVAPAELEATLLTINGIEDCAVIGVPHDRFGEVPRAFIVKNREMDETEIHDYMKMNLSEHKQLKGGIVFVNEIPKLPSGKICRRLLKGK